MLKIMSFGSHLAPTLPGSEGSQCPLDPLEGMGQPVLMTRIMGVESVEKENHGVERKDGGDASPAVKKLGGDSPPDSRMKWPKSGVFSDFMVFFWVGWPHFSQFVSPPPTLKNPWRRPLVENRSRRLSLCSWRRGGISSCAVQHTSPGVDY